jgi:Acyl-CoA reductase (LuxC)
MAQFRAPLIIRGKVIDTADLEFGGRRGGGFATPDVSRHLDALALETPSSMADLYQLSFADIVGYLVELGSHLEFDRNPHVREAFELSVATSGLSEGQLRYLYGRLNVMFNATFLREMAERTVGIPYLDGWVEKALPSGTRVAIRAFGARAVHIVAGNNPAVSLLSIVRNALTRSDAIIKTPSNDPLTAAAIARTMVDMAPDHPLTRHLSVAYWKGGDTSVEEHLYRPRNIEKIIAWGGLASISHIAKYIQPGIDLITLDPKLSSTIVGAEAFQCEQSMREVAERIALDVGAGSQEGCVNARVIYIQSGTDAKGIERANQLGRWVYEAIQALPPHVSGPAKAPNVELADELEGLRFSADSEYRLFGGGLEGGVVVSQIEEPVDFARILCNRVANLVPVDSLETPIRAVNAYTQTIGIYPESLKREIRDRLAFHGGQRIVSLGYASNAVGMALAGPQDSIEPMRRMCKWIVDEASDPAVVPLASRL